MIKFLALALLCVGNAPVTTRIVIDESNVQCSATPRIADGVSRQAHYEASRLVKAAKARGEKVEVITIDNGESYKVNANTVVLKPSC